MTDNEAFWTFEREMAAVRKARIGQDPLTIAREFGTDEESVRSQLKYLMSPNEFSSYTERFPIEFQWTRERLLRLREMRDSGMDVASMCAEFGLNSAAIRLKLESKEPDEALVSAEATTDRPERSKSRWRPEEIELAMSLCRNKVSPEDIAPILKRTPDSTRAFLRAKLDQKAYWEWIRSSGGNVRQKFQKEDDAKLLGWADECVPLKVIGERLGRVNGENSVLAQLRRLKGSDYVETYLRCSGSNPVKPRARASNTPNAPKVISRLAAPGKHWSEEDKAELRSRFNNGETHAVIAVAMGRSSSSVDNQCNRMGLRRRTVLP